MNLNIDKKMAQFLVLLVSLLLQGTFALDSGCEWGKVREGKAFYGQKAFKKNLSLDECLAWCEKQTRFKCRSASFTPKTGFCSLSDEDIYTSDIKSYRGTDLYMIECQNDPRNRAGCDIGEPIMNMQIRGNDLRKIRKVDVETCKQRCYDEDSFHCISIEYTPARRMCVLQGVDRYMKDADPKEGTNLYERLCKPTGCKDGSWTGPLAGFTFKYKNYAAKYDLTDEQCKETCRNLKDFDCKSIAMLPNDYSDTGFICNMYKQTQYDGKLTYAQPSARYYELAGCDEPICDLKADVGTGDGEQTRIFFNLETKQCEEFTFKGVGGNKNNFASKEECETACDPATFVAADICTLKPNMGSGTKFSVGLFYNALTDSCTTMWRYSDTGGNGNNFFSENRCEKACKKNRRG